jgi:TonB-linked SusC/RagA family outer membrane protein
MEKKCRLLVFPLKSISFSNIKHILKRSGILLVLITSQLIGISTSAIAQEIAVTGKVTDNQTGETMPGVNILIKGTLIGTTTGSDGKYSLSVSDRNAVLVFSFIGYSSQEVPLAGRSVLDVVLVSDLTSLEEVIVTGYGTQKKVDVIGSVSSVRADQILTVPAPTIAQSVMGRTSGVFVKTQNAQPGDYSGISYNIRGFGEALIIIDGMPASNEDFLLLDPNDIEEFNVLKDAATASVYGARAGNGVILVTTKRGKLQQPKFTYNANYGLQKITMLPHPVTAWQNAQFENLSLVNAGLDPKWSQEVIDKFIANNDPEYPNTNWWDLTLRKFAPQTQHNISVRGGSEKVKYFVSGGYYYQESLYRSNDLKNKKYNLRSNLDIAITDKLSFGIDLSILLNNYIGPSWDMDQSDEPSAGHGSLCIMQLLYRSRPQYPAVYPDPTKFSAMGNDDLNPVSATEIDAVGYKKWNSFTGDNKFTFSYKLPYGFNAKALFNYRRTFKRQKRHELLAPAYWYDYDAQGNIQYHNHRNYNMYDWIKEEYYGTQALNQQYILTWNGKFGDHNINALAVYEYLSSDAESFTAQRIRYEFDIDYLFAGPDLDKSNTGTGSQDGRIGQILSIDYNFKEKYLISFRGRRDGSPKFPAETRWGIFPSVSVGWRISQEDFLKTNVPFINNLKLRASFGKLGYDRTGNYQYLRTFSLRPASLMVDGVVKAGIRADNIPNLNITWEKITTSNIGVDFGLFRDKLTGSFDVFYRKRSDVLGARQVSLPDIVGASMPQENIEEYSNRGVELSLIYMKKSGNVTFEVGANASYSRERIEFVDQPVYATEEARRRSNRIGQWADSRWGYMADGVFTSQEEIDNWAIIDGKNNATVNVGDIKLIDYNGDGLINSSDYVIIGRGTSPDLIFGLHGTVSWKGFDLSMLWQGAGLYDIQYGRSADLSDPFMGGNAPLLEMYKYSYVPENNWGIPVNTDPHPIFPRFYWPSYSTQNKNTNSSFWYKDGTYLRLKTIELGYNVPAKMINRFGIGNMKLFFSGYNVLTFAALDFYDPELQSSIGGVDVEVYPPTANYSFGLILDF